MQEKLLKKEYKKEISTAEKYLLKYLQDLQKHFTLTNTDLTKILQSSLNLIKKDNRPKRWWHFGQKQIK